MSRQYDGLYKTRTTAQCAFTVTIRPTLWSARRGWFRWHTSREAPKKGRWARRFVLRPFPEDTCIKSATGRRPQTTLGCLETVRKMVNSKQCVRRSRSYRWTYGPTRGQCQRFVMEQSMQSLQRRTRWLWAQERHDEYAVGVMEEQARCRRRKSLSVLLSCSGPDG